MRLACFVCIRLSGFPTSMQPRDSNADRRDLCMSHRYRNPDPANFEFEQDHRPIGRRNEEWQHGTSFSGNREHINADSSTRAAHFLSELLHWFSKIAVTHHL